MRMYNPAYGWMQDDHIYERIIGWRGPMPRWAGGDLNWMFGKAGKRSAFVGWQGNMSMSLSSFLKSAWNHPLGGSWSGGESYLFSNYSQAVTVGWTYVEEHNGWRYVPGGKEGVMARLQQALAASDLLGALQAQIGPPTVFVNMYATPKGFDVDEYLTGLRSALIANGFSNDLVVERSSISGRLKAWWNNSPTATVTIKNFRLGQDELEKSGYSRPKDPHSIIIYNGLSETGPSQCGSTLMLPFMR